MSSGDFDKFARLRHARGVRFLQNGQRHRTPRDDASCSSPVISSVVHSRDDTAGRIQPPILAPPPPLSPLHTPPPPPPPLSPPVSSQQYPHFLASAPPFPRNGGNFSKENQWLTQL